MEILELAFLADVAAGKSTIQERAPRLADTSAVVSLHLTDLKVDFLDSPGLADLVAEVERSLRVLAGVALVAAGAEKRSLG